MDEAKAAQLRELYNKRVEINKAMAALKHEGAAMDIQDYPLKDVEGNPTTLSEVFGDYDKLVLIHNMGKSCPYCTMWADGLNGLYKYVEKGFDGVPARFILVNNDEPAEIKEFAASRGWNFDCFSCKGTSMFMDLGFANEHEGQLYFHPGYSTIIKDADGKLSRFAADQFGPGDSYCGVWHFYDHLPQDVVEKDEA